jgi:[acyl-carrier-protein] S-malonyltransferase
VTTVAVVAGRPVSVEEVDERERRLRAGTPAAALPRPGTSEGRQLRRWLTQLLVAERVIALAGADGDAPDLTEVLPDTAAGLEIGSIAAAVLTAAVGRAVFARVTAGVDVSTAEIADYHRRNPARFAPSGQPRRPREPVPLNEVSDVIAEHLRAAARRRVFRQWLDARCAELVELTPGYEHPGDPRQPDNIHRH